VSFLDAFLLASAVLPVVIVAIGSWLFLRAGRRWDEREAQRDA
jgi:hypothetical protein